MYVSEIDIRANDSILSSKEMIKNDDNHDDDISKFLN